MQNILDILISFLREPYSQEKLSLLKKHSQTVGVISNGTLLMPEGEGTVKYIYPYLVEKCNYLSRISGLNIYPIPIGTRDVEEFVYIVKNIYLPFDLLVMENVALPGCLAINYRLSQQLPIPVIHEEKSIWPIPIVVAVLNACKLKGIDYRTAQIVINGVEILGTGIARLLLDMGCKNVVLHDQFGIINASNPDTFTQPHQAALSQFTNPKNLEGNLEVALKGADIYIGTQESFCLQPESIRLMADKPIVFSLGLLSQDIGREKAQEAGAYIYMNLREINPFLVYTGLVKGLLKSGVSRFEPRILFPALVNYIINIHDDLKLTGKLLPEFSSELQQGIEKEVETILFKEKDDSEKDLEGRIRENNGRN